MKPKTYYKERSRNAWSSLRLKIRSIVLIALISAGIQAPLQAQETQFTRPTWWFGIASGANLNFYDGTTQSLTSGVITPATFHEGDGVGLYIAPLIEFHRPDSRWGMMLQAGYDSRKGSFDQVSTPCNCPADLSTDLSYITVEPSLRFAPFKSNFYLYGGPRLAFNLSKSFTYTQGINPDYPEQVAGPDIEADFSNMEKTIISMQVGAGYDIQLSSRSKQTQYVLSPFVSFQPYIGQNPRSIETWNLTTLRVGAALKLGRRHKIAVPAVQTVYTPIIAAVSDPAVEFTINSPRNVPSERRVRETFPLRNYIFFNKGSAEIPDRYVMLNKNQVKEFKEDQLEVFVPKTLSGRSGREMTVYHNVINILGDRMGKDLSTSITLVGSSEKGPQDGREMAESVKRYLTEVFGIEASRISTEGRDKPKIPSEQPGGTRELDLLREEDQRVSIESGSPALLMEFQSGPETPLKPVEIMALQEAPLDSYVSFNVHGWEKAFSSWGLEIRDEKDIVQYFGPFTQEKISMPGKSIMNTRPEGYYKVTMIGQTKNGKTVRKEKDVHMTLWTPPFNEEGMRFSVLFEFNDSRAISIYEKYLTEIVTPKIPEKGTVIIHGYTDMIGEESHNQTLSQERALAIRTIIENALAKAGRSDVTFEVYGFGENQTLIPFENKLPEERSYNRTVIIDIIPGK